MNLSKSKFYLSFCLTAGFMLLFSAKTNAQDVGKAFQLGLTGSTNYSWVKAMDKEVLSGGLGVGYSFGITGDVNLNSDKKNYFLSIDVLSTVINPKIKFDDGLEFSKIGDSVQSYKDLQYSYKINYVEIPISAKFKVNEIGYTTWFAQIGLAPGFVYSSQAKYKTIKSNDIVKSEYERFRSSKKVNKDFNEYRHDIYWYRLATFVGAGMEYRFSGNTAAVASLRLNNGLSNFLNNKKRKEADDNYTYRTGAAHDKFIALHVGIIF